MYEREETTAKNLTSSTNLRQMQNALVEDIGRIADEVIVSDQYHHTELTAANLGKHLNTQLSLAKEVDDELTAGIGGDVVITPLLDLIRAFTGDTDFDLGIGCLRIAQMHQQRTHGFDDNGFVKLWGCYILSENPKLEAAEVFLNLD